MRASFNGVLGALPATDLTFTVEPQKDKNKSVKLFAWRGEERVGVIYVSFFAASLKHAAYIQYFFVPEEARGTGVAVALLQEARRYAREQRPELRWLLADVRWPGSLAVMNHAYGQSALNTNTRMDERMPIADWDGVRDGPSQQVAWFVGDPKAMKQLMRERGGGQSAFLDVFMSDTNFIAGGKKQTLRRQFI